MGLGASARPATQPTASALSAQATLWAGGARAAGALAATGRCLGGGGRRSFDPRRDGARAQREEGRAGGDARLEAVLGAAIPPDPGQA